MLEDEREAVGTVRANPWLLFGGGVVAAAWVAVQVAVVVPVTLLTLPQMTHPVFVVLGTTLLAVPFVPPALSGLYATVQEARAAEGPLGPDETLRAYGRGVRDHALELTAATVVFRVVAVLPALAVFILLLGGDTALNYWQYATSPGAAPGTFKGSVELGLVVLYGMVASGVGRLVFAFYDLPVLFGGAKPRRGWRAALRFARRRPRQLLSYGGGRLLLWTPMALVVYLEHAFAVGTFGTKPVLDELVLLVAVALAVGTVVSTAVAAHHVEVYERTVAPVLAAPAHSENTSPDSGDALSAAAATGGAGSTRRSTLAVLALVALLVVGTGVGTAVVRVDDVRPMPASERPVDPSMDADAVAANAQQALGDASYRSRTRETTVNTSTGERESQMTIAIAVDRRTRRALVSARVEDDDSTVQTGYYGSETTLAFDFPGGQDPTRSVRPTERIAGSVAGEWTIMHYAGYPWVAEVADQRVIRTEDRDLQVVERTPERVVVGFTRRPDGEDADGVRFEQVRLVVDQDTGRPLRYVRNRTVVKTDDGAVVSRHRVRRVRRYTDYGSPDVRRPDPLPTPGPLELLWDYVYY